MEVPGMDDAKIGSHMTSAVAFVDGGIQEACDEACSICLEAFCDSDPSSVTSCKHEFHLQCILEWCQRSSNCPMCWQPISLKDPTSQELLEATERERSFNFNPTRNSTIFHHPTLGNFELQHVPVGVNDAALEDRIIQHLATAAAMGGSQHVARRDGSRSRSSAHGRPHILVFSTHPNAPHADPVSSSLVPVQGESDLVSGRSELCHNTPHCSTGQNGQILALPGSTNSPSIPSFYNRSTSSRSSHFNQDRAGPSNLRSISDSWKSRFNSISMRYKESISKSTRGLKEKLFCRSTSMAEIGSEVRREVNAGIATVSRMMDRLENRENSGVRRGPLTTNMAGSSATDHNEHNNVEGRREMPVNDCSTAALAARSTSI